MSGWFYFAVFLLLANLTTMFWFYVRMKNRFSEKRILSDIRKEVEQLVTELGRETDRDVEILESRIRALRDLMDEADRRILLADREEAKRRVQPVIPPETPTAPPAGQVERTSTTKEPADTAAPVSSEPVTIYTRPRITRSGKSIPIEIPVREQVLQMARKNISAEMISKTTGMSLGEVDLILAMNNSSL